MEDDFEIVNHQIQHDTNLRATVGVGGKAVRFDESGPSKAGFERTEDRVKTFDVPYLKNKPAVVGKTGQSLGVGGVLRDRFFD